jgi:acetylornithine deacetylase
LGTRGIEHSRIANNVFAFNKYFDASKPTILLNSHHDTVKPNPAFTLDPFTPVEKDGKLFGLGSNDAGGPLVSLISTFVRFYNEPSLKYNLVLAATAEEEISGHNGIEMLLPTLGKIDFAIVGEPTQMQMAIAEKGLLVLDCTVTGKAGHAARNEGDNAIYKAMRDIEWFKSYQFRRISDLLGPVKMSVTVINTENKAHNVVPSLCTFVADIRVNELYNFDELLDEIKNNVNATVTPRSKRMRSSLIPVEHVLVQSGLKLGRTYYGSPTTSDKALMPFPALKMGPGDSARSHTADEFIYTAEIREGIEIYINLLKNILH